MALTGLTTINGLNYVATVDPATGIVVPLGTGFSATFKAGGVTLGGSYLDVSGANGTLDVLSAVTGQIVDAVNSPTTQLAYDSSASSIYGVVNESRSYGLQYLTVINPTTGSQAAVGSGYSSRRDGYSIGEIAAVNGTVYILSGNPQYTIDLLEIDEKAGTDSIYQISQPNGGIDDSLSARLRMRRRAGLG